MIILFSALGPCVLFMLVMIHAELKRIADAMTVTNGDDR